MDILNYKIVGRYYVEFQNKVEEIEDGEWWWTNVFIYYSFETKEYSIDFSGESRHVEKTDKECIEEAKEAKKKLNNRGWVLPGKKLVECPKTECLFGDFKCGSCYGKIWVNT